MGSLGFLSCTFHLTTFPNVTTARDILYDDVLALISLCSRSQAEGLGQGPGDRRPRPHLTSLDPASPSGLLALGVVQGTSACTEKEQGARGCSQGVMRVRCEGVLALGLDCTLCARNEGEGGRWERTLRPRHLLASNHHSPHPHIPTSPSPVCRGGASPSTCRWVS